MIEPVFKEFVYDVTTGAVASAGITAIFNFSNPRAVAASVIAANVGTLFFIGVVHQIFTNPEDSSLFWGGGLVVGYIAGYNAGKMVDPQFGGPETAISWIFAANAANGLAIALGIQK